jgi:hypothetical protein
MLTKIIIGASIILAASSLGSPFALGDNPPKKIRRIDRQVKIIAVPAGPSQEVSDAIRTRVLQSAVVQSGLGGKKYRLMSLRYVDNGTSAPRRFRATFYDYSDDRTLVAEGDLAGREPIAIDQAAFQPLSNEEEFDEAVAILRRTPSLRDNWTMEL